MSNELSQILSLANKLTKQELVHLIGVIEELKNKGSSDKSAELSPSEKDEIRSRFALIDKNETKLSNWEDVKTRVFGQGQ